MIELGDGVYGAEAASQYYFKRHAKDLTPYQAACIASIIPSPIKWKMSMPMVVARQNWILQQMANFGGVLNYNQKPFPQTIPAKK